MTDSDPSPPAQTLPPKLEQYRSTPVFTEASVPAGLLANHSTKDGVWGQIRVHTGTLRYLISDPRRQTCSSLLEAHLPPGIVEPTILHRVEPVGPVTFQVDFFRAPASEDGR